MLACSEHGVLLGHVGHCLPEMMRSHQAPAWGKTLDPLAPAGGYGTFRINGHSIAYAEATAIAKAVAIAQTSASTCGKCSAAGKTFVTSFEKIYLTALAEFEYDVEESTAGGEVEFSFSVLNEAIQSKTVTAFADAIAVAKADDDECSGEAVVSTGAGVVGEENLAGCVLKVGAASNAVVEDALAVAIATASAEVCLASGTTGPFTVEAEVCFLSPHPMLPQPGRNFNEPACTLLYGEP